MIGRVIGRTLYVKNLKCCLRFHLIVVKVASATEND